MKAAAMLATLAAATALTPIPVAVANPDCAPATVRLTSVSAEATDGTLTGTPAGTDTPIRLRGDLRAYHRSVGFGDDAPAAVTRWDQALARVSEPIDPNDPNWYGKGKSRVFATRALDDIATEFPDGTLRVSYSPGDRPADWCAINFIQPVAD